MTGRVDFVLEGEGKALAVSYIGNDPLPDTFVDKSQALIEGRPTPEGKFVADHVQAKCASKYEAAPGGANVGSGGVGPGGVGPGAAGYPASKSQTAPTGTTQSSSK